MTDKTQLLPVTPEAREAAALLADNVLAGLAKIDGNDVAAIRHGIWDDDDTDLGLLVQAFAKFESDIRASISHSLPGEVGIKQAAQRALQILERNLHRQTEKCDDAIMILRAALSAAGNGE